MNKVTRGLLVKSSVLIAVLFAAFFASGVILAQSSQDYDLGCRAELTAGGKWTDYPTVGVQLNSSFGQWNAGRTTVQGSGVVVHSGYILSAGQGSGAAQAVPSVATSTDGLPEGSAIVADGVYLPAMFAEVVMRYVRPCNWPWASSSAVPDAN